MKRDLVTCWTLALVLFAAFTFGATVAEAEELSLREALAGVPRDFDHGSFASRTLREELASRDL